VTDSNPARIRGKPQRRSVGNKLVTSPTVSELAVEALYSRLRHAALAVRDEEPVKVDVTELVPGNVVRLAVGDVVPADVRLLHVEGLECDEAVLTGESLPAEKRSDPATSPESSLDLASCAKEAEWV
jgi:P-type Mg2+ transporter